MMRGISTALSVLVLLAVPGIVHGDSARPSVLERALNDELARAMTLSLPGGTKPFYVAYQVVDATQASLMAEFGGVIEESVWRNRTVRVDVRVGTPEFGVSSLSLGGSFTLPVDDDYFALRRALWLATDQAYKAAVEQLEKRRAARAVRQDAGGDDKVPEFSKESATRVVEGPVEPPPLTLTGQVGLMRGISAVLGGYPELQEGHAELTWRWTRKTFASTEGAFASTASSEVHLGVEARMQAADGMPLAGHVAISVPKPADLPSEGELTQRVRAMAGRIDALRSAPVVDDYSGPILFEGRAAGELLRRLFIVHLSGTPPPSGGSETPGALGPDTSFARKFGKRVLPATFSVVDAPTAKAAEGTPLLGTMTVDDEGVKSRRVELVEKGRLTGFLMSRTPRKRFPNSNGHGRIGGGGSARGGITNLFVESSKSVSEKALERLLVKRAKAAGEEYGLIVSTVGESDNLSDADVDTLFKEQGMDGGATMLPLVVYRVDRSGKRELVRGIVIKGLAVRSFRDIVAAGRKAEVYNFLDNGNPASIVAPSLLLDEADARSRQGPHPRRPRIASPLAKP